MTKHPNGLNCLDTEGTQYLDLPGIISFNISNFFTEDGEYLPHPAEVLSAGQKATCKELKGSDAPNLLPQARALLLQKSVVSHMVEGGIFDIVDIVQTQYPTGVMLQSKSGKSDEDTIYRNIDMLDGLFHQPKRFYPQERVEMVMEFERELERLHLAELLLHSPEFKVDSMLFGLKNMSSAERILRGRINTYIESEVMDMLRRCGKDIASYKHLEISSMPLAIGERVEECGKFYNKYGGGAYAKSGILFAGSGSSGVTFYDALNDTFPAAIPGFYKECVA